jgi:catechol O-methyltransferase
VLAADNVIKPGNPLTLSTLGGMCRKRRRPPSKGTTVNCVDARFKDRISKQYVKGEGEAKLDGASVGNPKLVYESSLINSPLTIYPQEGVKIIRCIREEQYLLPC